jgi:hypothetical protein
VGYTASDTDVTCTIDLLSQAKWVLEYYPVEVLEYSDDVVRIRFAAPDAEVPARLLLRLGKTASLVEGAEVRERLQLLGAQLIEMYR